ncbi:MAG TPA: hypothetical protein VNR64_00740 [Vicinamibacterales bacterium]|nr:hypothetical protein [Vicinamibacterales bacterium]
MLPLGLLLLGLWRFFPPAEYLMGGKDPGVYMNEGIQIAQHGRLVIVDPLVSSVPDFARDLFFPWYHQDDYYSLRFMGFFVQSPDAGTVVGQFPHLYPASIAIGYGLHGLTGARWATGAWALLGLLAVYFAGARWIGRVPAAAAAALLALNVVQVWFARYPNSEIAMQGLLFAALLANARAHVDEDPFFAPVAGALLGLLLFLRLDSALGIAGVLAALTLGLAAGQRPRWTFWPPLAIGTLLAAWYYAGPMRAYAALPLGLLRQISWDRYAAAAILCAAIVWVCVWAMRREQVSRFVVRWTPAVLNVIVIALAVYALGMRHPGGRLASHDAYALRTFAQFYFTVPAVIAALLGYLLIARGRFWQDAATLLTVTLFAVVFFYKIRIVPDHFWMARRFVAVVLPGGLLLVSAAALMGVRGRWLSTRLIRGPIGIVFLVILGYDYARAARPILHHVEYAGIVQRLEQLASLVHPDDLLIVESRNASDAHVLALPLAYIYDRHVLVLASPVPDKATFAAFLNRSAPKYQRVLFLGGGGTDLLSSRWTVHPIASERFQVPEYDSPRDAYPRFVRQKEFDYSIYEFGPPGGDDAPFTLDVGVNDDLNVLRFNAKEATEGRTIRWTRARSYISITRLHPSDRRITLWMSNGGRPPAAPAARVTAILGDVVLGSVEVQHGFQPYSFEIPPPLASADATAGEPVRLTLETVTWNPHKVLGTPDDRDLGVMVDRVAVQ